MRLRPNRSQEPASEMTDRYLTTAFSALELPRRPEIWQTDVSHRYAAVYFAFGRLTFTPLRPGLAPSPDQGTTPIHIV